MYEEKTEKIIWEEKLSEYKILFSTNKQQYSSELRLIHDCYTLLKKKISFATIGPVKAGKSTVLNAILGRSFLTAEVTACTFFATKIRPSKNQQYKFYDEEIPDKVFTDYESIKKKIKQLNDVQRDEKANGLRNKEGSVWILEAPCMGLNRDNINEKMKNLLGFIEIVDLPGISDDVYAKKNKNDKNEIESQEEIYALKFNDLVKILNIDAITVVFDITQSHEMEKFSRYFKMNLFRGPNREKLFSAFENKSIIKIVNKFDVPKIDEREEAKNKIQNMIFCKFYNVLNKKNLGLWDKIKYDLSKMGLGSDFLDIDQLSLKEYNRKFKEFLKESRFSFVSASQALKSIEISPEDIEDYKKKLKKAKKTPEQIQIEVNAYIDGSQQDAQYDPDSNFEKFTADIIDIFLILYEKNIKLKMMDKLEYLERQKKFFVEQYVILKDDKVNILKFQQESKESFKKTNNHYSSQLCYIVKKELKNLINFLQNYLDMEIQKAIYLLKEIISEMNLILTRLESKIKEKYFQYLDEITKNNKDYKIFHILKNKLNMQFTENIDSFSKKLLEWKFSLYPDNIDISNNSDSWIIGLIIFIRGSKRRAEKTWVNFRNNSEKIIEMMQINLFEDIDMSLEKINEHFLNAVAIYEGINKI